MLIKCSHSLFVSKFPSAERGGSWEEQWLTVPPLIISQTACSKRLCGGVGSPLNKNAPGRYESLISDVNSASILSFIFPFITLSRGEKNPIKEMNLIFCLKHPVQSSKTGLSTINPCSNWKPVRSTALLVACAFTELPVSPALVRGSYFFRAV